MSDQRFEQLLERRRALGQDVLDEVWDGVYHMNPARLADTPRSPASSRCCWTSRLRRGLVPTVSIFNLCAPGTTRFPTVVCIVLDRAGRMFT